MCTDKNNKADLLMILFHFTYSFFKCWKTTSLWLWSFQSSSLINFLCKIKPNYTSHSYKKPKDSLETRIVDIFAWTWNIWVGRTENTSKQKKNGGFCEDLLIENDFETVLVTFCCFDDGGNASEAVRKIATDQNELSQ